jgi:mannose/fructose/N-acetylgalactosamine-specific phosphotransferase system component IIC
VRAKSKSLLRVRRPSSSGVIRRERGRTYRDHMDLRSVGRRYGDLLIAAILAVLLTVEVLLWPRADHALPVAAALLATLPLALRRRLPVVALLLVAIGIEALTQLMPGFDNDSFTLMVAFVLTLYSAVTGIRT